MVAIVDRPQNSVDTDASTTLGAVVGQMTFIDIPSGSPLSASKIGHLEMGGLTMRVPVGERAMSIALDPVKGVADLLQAGDHVDVIAVTQPRGSSGAPRAATILRNKVVLAMGSTMEVPAATEASSTTTPATETAIETATLAVLPEEARILALADLNATLRLSLRSPREKGNAPPDAFILDAPVDARAMPSAAAPVVAAAPAPAPARPAAHGIPLIDGDQVIR
jgi:pilus assembly protein CpaB